MKLKIFTLLLLAAFSLAAFAQKPEGVATQASVSPVLDGEIDAVWDEAAAYDINQACVIDAPRVFTLGNPGDTYWKSMWTEEGIYVLLSVTDDVFFTNWMDDPVGANAWQYDKTEIYFDCNSYDLDDGVGPTNGPDGLEGHYQFAPDIVEGEMDGAIIDQDGWSTATLVSDPNYNVEYFIPWDKLIDKDGLAIDRTLQIGFDVTIIDRDPGDEDRKRAVWANVGNIDQAWANMNDCGLISFEGTEAPTMIESLTLTAGDITENNGSVKIQTAIVPEDATTKKILWTIVDGGTGRATVSKDGVVTGILNGTVTINGATTDGSYIEETIDINISHQIVTRGELNLIRNGYFERVNADGTPPEFWWTGGTPTPAVVEGVIMLDPSSQAEDAVDPWSYVLAQNDFPGTSTTEPYTFTYRAWSDASRPFKTDFEWGVDPWTRYGTSSHPDAESANNGTSQWSVTLNTEPTRYTYDVVFDQYDETKSVRMQVMVGEADDVVYLDSLELFLDTDLELVTLGYIPVTSIEVSAEGGASAVALGGTLQMSALATPAEATLTAVRWSVVPGTGDATIDAAGLLTGDTTGTITVVATAMDDSKVKAEYNVSVNWPAGVPQHKVNSLSVYPNPAVNELNVVLTRENSTVAIYNSVGMKMEEVTVTGTEHRFNISSYASGIYFVKTGNAVAKFVK